MRSILRRGLDFTKRTAIWLRSTPHTVWIFAGPILAVIAVGLLPPILHCKERDIRTLGMILQLTGFALLAIQYDYETHDSNGNSWRTWWQNRPRIKPRHITIVGAGVSMATSFAESYARVLPGNNAPVERQLELLWADLNALHQRVADEAQKASKLAEKNREASASGLANLDRKISDMRSRIEESSLRNARISALGAALFSSGVLLASWSPELANVWGSSPSCERPLIVRQ